MVNIKDLWIGDLLLLKKSRRIGKFDGEDKNSKIRVKIGDKIVLTSVSNIEIAPSVKEDPFTNTTKDNIQEHHEKPKSTNFIDLHMEELNPTMVNARPERILDIQIKEAKTFIETAIENKQKRVEIIHGKGEGVLKSEITHLLTMYDEVQFTFDKNQGGSTEIWFK